MLKYLHVCQLANVNRQQANINRHQTSDNRRQEVTQIIQINYLNLKRSGNHLEEQPMSRLTTHKHPEYNYLCAYKARLYNCRESSTNRPFYAKQSQSQEHPNQRKLFYNMYICESGHLVKSEKQSQNKPNLVRRRRIANERKSIYYNGL